MQVALVSLGATGAVGLASFMAHKIKKVIQDRRLANNEPTAPLEDNCIICDGEETAPLISLECGHKFHEKCLELFKLVRIVSGENSGECPLQDCRHPISPIRCENPDLRSTENRLEEEALTTVYRPCLLCVRGSKVLPARRFPCGHIYHEKCLGQLLQFWAIRGIAGRDTSKCPHRDCRVLPNGLCNDLTATHVDVTSHEKDINLQEGYLVYGGCGHDKCAQEFMVGNPYECLQNAIRHENSECLEQDTSHDPVDSCVVCESDKSSPLTEDFPCGHKCHARCLDILIRITRGNPLQCPHQDCKLEGHPTAASFSLARVNNVA